MFSPRVTNSAMTNTFLNDIQRNLASVLKLQHQISTGKRINFPSDDPIGADRTLDYREVLERTGQYSKNVDDLDSQSSFLDKTFGHMGDVLYRVRDLAVRGANEAPENQSNRDAMAQEIDNLINEMYNQSNQMFDGRSVFAGNKTSASPFSISNTLEFITTNTGNVIDIPSSTIGGVTRQIQAITDANSVKQVKINGQDVVTQLGGSYTVDPATNQITLAGVAALNGNEKIEVVFDKSVAVSYSGDSGAREVEINDRSRIGVNFAGATSNPTERSVFGKFDPEGTTTGTAELFQNMMDLRDNLRKYSTTNGASQQGISDGITNMENARANIDNIRAELGGRVNRLELAKDRLENIKINTKALLSKREDVDMTEALSQLVLQQNTYQAALGAGSRIIQMTLLDFLR